MSDRVISFGPFRLLADSGVLERDGVTIAIGRRGAALLEALATPAGAVKTKQELMDAAWPELAVEESNLSVQIAALRRHLGTLADGSEWIVTLPRVGYRLAGTAEAIEAAGATRPSLAVLPFRNASGDREDDYFADGVAEDIITALSRFRSFAVIARNSSFRYRGDGIDALAVAGELGVRYVLEGSVRRAGGTLRITTRLTDCGSGESLWAEKYDGAAADMFDFQDKITESVATVVEPRIQRAEIERALAVPAGSLSSYDRLLRARALIVSEAEADNRRAALLLDEILAAEPDHALALAHASWVLEHRLTMAWPPIGPDDRRNCVAHARRGLDYARGDTTVMVHCALSLLHVARDYDLAMAVFRAAEEANPNSLLAALGLGIATLHCGEVEDAIALFRRCAVLSPVDPLGHISLSGIGHANMILGRHDEALTWAGRALAVNAHFDPIYWVLIAANVALGRMDEARRQLAAYLEKSPEATIERIRAGQPDRFPERMTPIYQGLKAAGLRER